MAGAIKLSYSLHNLALRLYHHGHENPSVSGANVGTSPNGKVTLQAADIALGTVTTSSSQNSVWDENNYSKYSSSTEVGSTISGGSVAISASNDLALRATTINAAPTGQVSLSAGHSVTIEAGSSSSNYDGKSQSGSNGLFSFQDKAQTSIQDQGIVRSTVNGGSVVISSGQGTGVGDITLSGLTVNAKALTLNAADGNGALNLNVAQTQHDESRTSASNSALWQSQAGQGSSNTDAQYNQFNLGANQPVITNKGAGTALAGTAGAGTAGATSTKSDTTVAMLSPKAGVGGASTALGDSTALTATSNTGVAGLTINAAKVNVQVGVTTRKTTDGEDSTFTKGTLQSSIQQLASQPGTAYIATLQSQLQSNPAFKNPDGTSKVNWQQIDQAHQNWNYESQGLTAAGAAVVALIVAACTAGAGIAALGPMAAGAMGFTTTVVEGVLVTSTAASMVSAAVVAGAGSLITQASISLINNQGDLGKTFQDLGSSQSLKQLATAMVTAGALQGLGSVPLGESGFTLNSINANSSFVSQLGKNLVNNTAGAMISTAINGGSVEKNLQSALVSAFIQTSAAQTANEIGNATMGEGSIKDVFSNSETAAKFANLTAHAIAGCIAGAATSSAGGGNGAAASSGCGAGAIGAAVGEATASLYGRANNTVEVASLVSGIAAVLIGGNANAINIASAAGGNAVANNYLNHDQEARRQQLLAMLKSKGTLTPALMEELNTLNVLDVNNDKAFVNNCGPEGNKAGCAPVVVTLENAIASYNNLSGSIPINEKANVDKLATLSGIDQGAIALFGDQYPGNRPNATPLVGTKPFTSEGAIFGEFIKFANTIPASTVTDKPGIGAAISQQIKSVTSDLNVYLNANKAEAARTPTPLIAEFPNDNPSKPIDIRQIGDAIEGAAKGFANLNPDAPAAGALYPPTNQTQANAINAANAMAVVAGLVLPGVKGAGALEAEVPKGWSESKLPSPTDATATSPYSSSGIKYVTPLLTDSNGNVFPTQPSLLGVGVKGGVGATADVSVATANGGNLNSVTGKVDLTNPGLPAPSASPQTQSGTTPLFTNGGTVADSTAKTPIPEILLPDPPIGSGNGGTVGGSTAKTPIPEILLPDPPVGSGARPAGSPGIGFDGYTPPASATPNAPGTVRVGNSTLDVHLIDEGGATQGKNIYGTHDMGAFNDALAANGGTVLSSSKVAGTDGIYLVQYQLPGKSATTKTVFDSNVYSQTDMASMAQSAAQSAINQATATGVTGPVAVNVGGLKWSVIVSPGPSGVLNVKTAYPIGGATWP